MKAKLLTFCFLLIATCMSAQDTARVIDRVYTSDNKVYAGQITDDRKGDSLTIEIYQSGPHVIDYKLITRIQYRADNPDYREPEAPKEMKTMRTAHMDTSGLDLVAFNGYRATPRVTDKLIKKRNTGIALTIAGACLIGAGAAIYASVPKQSSSSGGYQLGTPSPGSIAGIVMIIAGVGISIPGAIIWGTTSHKIHKAEQEN